MGEGRDAVLHHGAPHQVPEEADDGGDGARGEVHHNAAGSCGDVRVCLHLLSDVCQVQHDSG